ncbi:GreA/GreB family elongation factor [Sphingomonas japonica]|uniref:Transcription elongation GreA/GreB family factor n=1 Tax=Sphingomonas japonica TaxID=511662 RepID=A0ABX0U200_9SPHN|nr:GreA/GreB family elongation factor [Sphingomonas japonica]NIJ23367.1 transcription elongation GreA/GreB family factor [Sphingomonas japonica]
MSVAFRREGDDEHKEPEFELPIPVGPNLVTNAGLKAIRAMVRKLEAEIAAQSDADAVKRLKRDLRYWNTQAATAEIAPEPAEDEVGIGSRVTVRVNGKKRRFTIVGHDEADPAKHKLAFTAPLARAVMGAAAGDFVAFADEEDAVEVVGVE